jgi:hypothetical protein
MVGTCGRETVAVFLADLFHQQEDAVRQRLREWYCEPAAKKGGQRQALPVAACFAALLGWVLTWWPAGEHQLAVALDATALGDRFTVLAVCVLYRACATARCLPLGPSWPSPIGACMPRGSIGH